MTKPLLVGLARDIQWWPAPLWRVGQRHRTFPLLYGRSVRVIVVHIRPPGAYFAVLPANVVELGYQLGAIAEGHDAAIDHGLQALRECDDPLVLQRYARRMIRARTMPSATLNGVAPVAAAQRSTSRVMAPMRATEASTASGWSSMVSWWKSMTPPALAR